MGAQRLTFLVVIAGTIISVLFFFRERNGATGALHVCSWSNYFPDQVITEFSKRTGVKVELSYISSNEELFSKLRAGARGFDVILPSDYMVRQMVELKMLRALNHEALPNLQYLSEFYRELPYDPKNLYSVVFTWGTTGIAVNTAQVKGVGETVSWKLLLDSPDPRHTSLLDDMREVFAADLFWKGQRSEMENLAVLSQAKKDILKTKNNILMFTSEPKPLLLGGELTITHIYSADAAQAQRENPKIRYFIPEEGATIWADNFAIPTSSQKVEDAHVFINYFLDPANAYSIATRLGLSTPNEIVIKRMRHEGKLNPHFYPDEKTMKKLHFLDEMRNILPRLSRMWTELKT